MTQKIYVTMVLLLASIALKAEPANLLNPMHYSFEDGGKAIYLQNADYWSISTEKAAGVGTYSLKFSSSEVLTTKKKANGGGNGTGINLPSGEYTLKVKVWMAADADITGFSMIIKTPWIVKNLNTTNIEREKWVELSLPLSLSSDLSDAATLFQVSADNVGKGTMYLDDVEIWGEKPLVPQTLDYTSTIKTLEEAQLSIPSGIYTVQMKVWKEANTTISTLNSVIEKPWISLVWDLENISANKWETISQQVILSDSLASSPFKLTVNNVPTYGGGTGTFYVDDIEFIKTGDFEPVTGLTLADTAITIFENTSHPLNPIFKPVEPGNNEVTWISSNPSIASINANGTVTAKEKGTTKITAISTNGSFKAVCEVSVVSRETSLNQMEQGHILITPNPFASSFTIRLENGEQYQRFVIYDIAGVKVGERTMEGRSQMHVQPSYNSMPAGIYFIHFIGNASTQTFRVIRK